MADASKSGSKCNCARQVPQQSPEMAEITVNNSKSLIFFVTAKNMLKFVANSRQNVSFLNIFHFHLHPIQNSSALHFSIPEKNEFLFCVFFSVNYEAIKYTYIFLPNKREPK